MKLGKLPAKADARDLQFGAYSTVTAPPATVAHEGLVTNWGELGNDRVGDCVIAGALHETLLWNREAGHKLSFTTPQALATYTAITGYNPDDPNTDRGTDMRAAAKYRQKHGVPVNAPHKISAYVALTPGNIVELETAVWQFGAAGVGIRFPQSAMDQFNAGEPWTVVAGSSIEGGHYLAMVGYDPEWFYCVTWGRIQKVARSFLTEYMDEGFAYLSPDAFTAGKTIDGFNLAALQADLKKLGREPTMGGKPSKGTPADKRLAENKSKPIVRQPKKGSK